MTTRREQLTAEYREQERRTQDAREAFERAVAEEKRIAAEIDRTPSDAPGEPHLSVTPMATALAATLHPDEDDECAQWRAGVAKEIERRMAESGARDKRTIDTWAIDVILDKVYEIADRVRFLERRVLHSVTELP